MARRKPGDRRRSSQAFLAKPVQVCVCVSSLSAGQFFGLRTLLVRILAQIGPRGDVYQAGQKQKHKQRDVS